MINNNALVTEVKQKANIKNLENLSLEETKKIVKLLKEDKIREKHLEALTKFSPRFIDSITDLVSTLPRLVEKIGSVNEKALDKIHHLNQTTKTLNMLASNVKSDRGKIKIAELIVQVAKEYNETIKEININNNNTWQRITAAVGITVAVVAGIFGIEPNET